MRTLIDFAIREEYSRVKALGDDLSEIGSLIEWGPVQIFRAIDI
jgi:IS5 family transposase